MENYIRRFTVVRWDSFSKSNSSILDLKLVKISACLAMSVARINVIIPYKECNQYTDIDISCKLQHDHSLNADVNVF